MLRKHTKRIVTRRAGRSRTRVCMQARARRPPCRRRSSQASMTRKAGAVEGSSGARASRKNSRVVAGHGSQKGRANPASAHRKWTGCWALAAWEEEQAAKVAFEPSRLQGLRALALEVGGVGFF